MKKAIVLIVMVLAMALPLAAFDSGYNSTKSLYDNGLYGELPGEVKPPPEQQQALQQKNAELLQKSLGDIVVTARNIPETLSLIPKTVEIISQKDSGIFGSTDLNDALDDISGSFVNRMGAGDAMASLTLRGANSRYTLIMQDGIPINDILTGGADLNMIDTSNADKIEMVKGGMSSIYGADAVAGVVNVITGKEEKKLATLIGGYGTAGFRRLGAASNYKIFNVDYSASFVDEAQLAYFTNSDFYKRAANAKVRFSNGFIDSSASGHYFKREMGVAYDSYGGPSPKARQYDEAFSVGVNEVINFDFIKVKIDGFLRSGDLRFKDPLAWVPQDSKSIKKEYQASLLGVYQEAGAVSAVAGYEANVKTIDSTAAGNRERMNHAAISNIAFKLFNESLLLSAGGRVDVNSQFGTYASENISAKYKFADGLELRASFDKSFSAPTFGELYWPQTVSEYYDYTDGNTKTSIMEGDANLKVEDFTSYEAGMSNKHDNMKESVTWFLRDSSNMITWDDTTVDGGPLGITVTSKLTNVKKARAMGIEVKFDISPFNFWDVSAQYSLLFLQDSNTNTETAFVDGGASTNQVYRFYTSLKLPFDAKLGVTAEYVDYVKDYRGYAIEPYFLLHAKITQKLNQNAELSIQAENILDNKEYHVVAYMPMPGRTVLAGVKLEF